MGRAPCCDKATVKKGPWSPEEDAKLKAYIEKNGTGGNWIALPQKIGLKRCGKSCRLRWLNYLRPNIKHGGFSEEEDNIIFSLYLSIGSRWSIIAAQLPGRTDNDIKNYWNTKLKKKLIAKQRQELQETRLKQEMVKTENQTENVYGMFGSSMNQETLNWPQLPHVVMNQRYQDQEHMKNMIKNCKESFLIKTLETNIENPPNYQTLLDFSYSQDDFGGFPMNSVTSSSTNSPLPNNHYDVGTRIGDHNHHQNQEMLQGYNDFPIDIINDMVLNNIPCLDGTEGNSYSADHSTISWEDIGSLLYPTFEDANTFGTQS